jgi:hypothetical protein
MSQENILTLSDPQGRVSKGGLPHRVRCPSFETHRCAMLLRMRWKGGYQCG